MGFNTYRSSWDCIFRVCFKLKKLENSNKNIYTAITDYYKDAKEINIRDNSYGEFLSEGKTYRFFIEDNNLHIKDIDENLETIVDGKYY